MMKINCTNCKRVIDLTGPYIESKIHNHPTIKDSARYWCSSQCLLDNIAMGLAAEARYQIEKLLNEIVTNDLKPER